MSFYFPLPTKKTKSKAVYDCNKCKRPQDTKVEHYVGKNYNGLVILKDYPISDSPLDGLAAVEEAAKKQKIRLFGEAAVVYAIPCLHTKAPTATQYKCCQQNTLKILKELKPKMIICLGEMAFQQLMELKTKTAITKIRNNFIPNYEVNAVVYPTFNPSPYLIGSKKYKDTLNRRGTSNLSYNYDFSLRLDLDRVFLHWRKFFRKRNICNKWLKSRKILEDISIREITTFKELKDLFENILFKLKKFAFDYETTNAYPHDDKFEIVWIQFGTKKNAWVLHEDLWKHSPKIARYIRKNLKKLLEHKGILKIIQNAKFEEMASSHIYDIKTIHNIFDTMIASHVINETKGTKSLDHLNLIRFGIPPYSDTIKAFIEPKEKEDLVNRIREAPRDDMLLYAGLDVITEYNQYLLLDKVLLNDADYPTARKNYEFLLKGGKLFSRMSRRGIHVPPVRLDSLRRTFNREMENVLDAMATIPEFQQYNKFLKEKNGAITDIDTNLKKLCKRSNRRKINLKIKA